ncbi:MAG TPA: zinc-binding dehydrogenase [Anaerolineales bacterium]|nr:zinc-binding dehydrogenase [Anaerolineales bacterium]
MKKVVITEHGSPAVLQIIETPIPEPKANEVRIKVSVTDITWADTMARRGQYPTKNKIPYAPGYDIVGAVDKIGAGVSSSVLNQRMAALLPNMGAYAEYVCVPQSLLVPVPDQLDSAQAVGVILNGLTAYAALHKFAKIKAGEKILITGAAGGLGTMLIQLAKLAGLDVYGSASTGKLTLVQELGATPLDYKTEDIPARIQQLSNGGVDVVIDLAGESSAALSSLCDGGRIITVGSLSMKDKSPMQMLAGLFGTVYRSLMNPKKKIKFFGSLPPMVEKDPAWYRATMSKLFNLVVEQKLKVIIAKRLPLIEATQGHALLESGTVSGKIVLEI